VSNVTPNLPQVIASHVALDEAVDGLNGATEEHDLLWGAQSALGSAPTARVHPHPEMEKEREPFRRVR